MPNHISNIVYLEVEDAIDEEEQKKIAELLKSVKTDYSAFDFNTIIPMPEVLRDTRSPSQPIEDKVQFEKELAEYKRDKDDKTKYVTKPITFAQSRRYKTLYGTDNWYEWANNNWGTKWNAYDINENPEHGHIQFDTAWSPPLPVFVALSAKFPNVKILIEYADEDIGNNCGEFELLSGEVVDDTDRSGDEEFACRVCGYDYADYLKDRED